MGDDEETFIDFNEDGIYNGSLCSAAAAAAGDCTTNLLNVSDETILTLSSQTAFFGLYLQASPDQLIGGTGLNSVAIDLVPETFTDNNGNGIFDAGDVFDPAVDDRNGNGVHDANGATTLEVDISDHFNGPLPAGTTITVTAGNCTIDTATNFEVGEFDTQFSTIAVGLSEDDATDRSTGIVTITATTPAANNLTQTVNIFEFTCLDLN